MKTFLPQVANEQPIAAQSDAATHFIGLWTKAIGDRAKRMRPDARLMRCASDHATYLDSRTPEQIEALPDDGHGSHIGRNGSTPNQRVKAAGYSLPSWHGDGNTVEFNVRTHRGPARALELYLGSDAHRPALMGEGFWEPAIVYGVGQTGSDYVVLVCPPEVTV